MSGLVRTVALALAVAGLATTFGCMTGRGSSIETLGLPEVEDRPGRPAVVVGWAYEDRSGWIVKNVRLDGESRPEWDERTERPAVVYLTPGTHTLQLSTAQLRDPSDRSSRSRRRYQTRPVEIELEDGYSQICVVRLEGEDRRRPVVRCESREILGEEDEASYDDEDEDGAYEDEYGDEAEGAEERIAAAEAAPGPAGAGSAASTGEDVPDPFATPAAPRSTEPARQAAVPATQAPAPVAEPARPSPLPQPPAAAPPPPRPLSLEERVERLERQLEELRRGIRP